MAQSETLDLPLPSSDRQLSRNLSSSKLSAEAPEFVPTRSTTKTQQQQPPPHRIIMPPPPVALMHVYSAPPPFHVPVQSPVPMPPHMVPGHHHVPPVRNRQNQNQHHHRQNQYYGGGGGDREEEVRKNDRKDQRDHSASSVSGLSKEAVRKILNQVEYYFSDINLATTDQLMKFISKDPEGYVPISVVASFKKINAYTNNHSQLAAVLRNSSKLIVSEDGRKVKRLHPLTESDMEELQSRIIVAENLPEDHCHQNLVKIFSSVGSFKTIRTCQPQSGKTDNFNFSNKLHAYVEYESVELAEKAVAELNDERNWRSGLRVRLMPKYPSKAAHAKGKKGHEGESYYEEEDDAFASEGQANEKQAEVLPQLSDIHLHKHLGEEHANDKEDGGHRKVRNKGRGKGRGRAQYHQNNHHNGLGNQAGSLPSTNAVNNDHQTKQPPGPRMPDGTRGFAMGRGKPVVNSV